VASAGFLEEKFTRGLIQADEVGGGDG